MASSRSIPNGLRTIEILMQLNAPLVGGPVMPLKPHPAPSTTYSRGYLLRIKNMDFDRIHISSKKIKGLNKKPASMKDVIDDIENIIDPDEWGAEAPRARGHRRKKSSTRFDMNLTKKTNPAPAILVFHFDKTGYTFFRDSSGAPPSKYGTTDQALTAKNHTASYDVMYLPLYADDTGNTIVTVCNTIPVDSSTGKHPEFEYNIAARIADSHNENYSTPIIIDPKVRNNG